MPTNCIAVAIITLMLPEKKLSCNKAVFGDGNLGKEFSIPYMYVSVVVLFIYTTV